MWCNMVSMSPCEKIGINEALKRFGGFVRYYDTTEPLSQLAVLVSTGNCRDILACCGGGDQALTMLGASSMVRTLWAVDINPAQLFILAAKAAFLKKKKSAPFLPSFGQLYQEYPQRIAAVEKDIRPLQNLYHLATGKRNAYPIGLSKKYAVVHEDGMFVRSESGPFWNQASLFAQKVRGRLSRLQFSRMDIFDSPDHFKRGSLDLIYLSDIFWQEKLMYYQLKLAKLADLLRPGGRIISHFDPGDDFWGRGVSPGRILAQQARELALRIDTREQNGYLVFERIRKR